MKSIVVILSIVCLFGCQTVIDDVAVPAAEIKAVVFYSARNSFDLTSASDFSNLELTKSQPVLNSSPSGDYEPISDAQIQLTGNGFDAGFQYYDADKNYIMSTHSKFEAGLDYTLKITTPDNGTLTSTVTMPDSIEQYALEVDSVDQEWQMVYNGRLSIPDNPNKDEYFRVEAFNIYNGQSNQMYVEGEYFSDETVSNGMINTRFNTYSWDDERQSKPKVYLILSAITKAHYEYGKALANYDPENPFSEPSPLPGNIDGGLGIFTLSNSRLVPIN